MSGTTTPTATSCFVDATGIHAPAFNDILSFLKTQVQTIFGSDTYFGNDSQDGQLLGIFAAAISDTNSMAIAVYNSYSPSTAQGVGLSSVVKINGISRLLPTASIVDLVVVGVAGTTITNGVAQDQNSNRWKLPPTVVIPFSGQGVVTATAENLGAISAPANSINKIATPTFGWQSVNNTLAAFKGADLETDALLRLRQARSTMLPSVTAFDGTVGAVANVAGVKRLQAYENDTGISDSNGIPGHSISIVVEGGDAQAIADALAAHKTPGAGTFGTTTQVVVDLYSVPHNINFFRPTVVPISIIVHVTPLAGYTSSVGVDIVNAVLGYITTNPIGSNVFLNKVVAVANLSGSESSKFNISSILMARNNGTPIAQDIGISFNESSFADTTTLTLSVP